MEALRVELTARPARRRTSWWSTPAAEIAEEKSRARADLRSEVVDLAIDAAARLIKANLDERSQRELVEEYIAALPAEKVA